MKELTEIGVKVNDSIEAVWAQDLNLEELGRLEAYITQQEVLTPLLNPNFILEHGFKLFDHAKERIKSLKPILQLKEKEKEGRRGE